MIPARGIFVVGVAAQRPLRDAGRVGERIEAEPLAAADVEPEDIRPGIHVHGEFSAYFRTAPSGREASSGPWGTEGLSSPSPIGTAPLCTPAPHPPPLCPPPPPPTP